MLACVLRMVCPMCGGNAGKLQEATMQLSEMVQVDQCIDSVSGTIFGDGTPCIEEQLETADHLDSPTIDSHIYSNTSYILTPKYRL